DNNSLTTAICKDVDCRNLLAVGDILDGEVELVASDEIDRRRGFEAAFGVDRHIGANHADLDCRVDRFERFGSTDIRRKRGGRCMKDEEVPVAYMGSDILKLHPVGWRVDQLRSFDERRRPGERGRIPE